MENVLEGKGRGVRQEGKGGRKANWGGTLLQMVNWGGKEPVGRSYGKR